MGKTNYYYQWTIGKRLYSMYLECRDKGDYSKMEGILRRFKPECLALPQTISFLTSMYPVRQHGNEELYDECALRCKTYVGITYTKDLDELFRGIV